jgi:hypothetical protein
LTTLMLKFSMPAHSTGNSDEAGPGGGAGGETACWGMAMAMPIMAVTAPPPPMGAWPRADDGPREGEPNASKLANELRLSCTLAPSLLAVIALKSAWLACFDL